ncbi:MAG: aminotransferase class I/II-fold pyridoxal phosphate-dependent enzyme, partial [Proteobacteria bacterium]|nr:aminotransferase class I/II-fold pyridoxal phosphate-dependent enzyme [Pseudomonadota bacterium]
EPETMSEIFKGVRGPDKGGFFLYSRHMNPTINIVDRYISAIEATEAAICTASGMSAIACSLLQLCKGGDHIVSSNTVYGGTHALFDELLPEMDIETTFVDPTDIAAFEAAITANTKAIYAETIGNPTLRITDIASLSKLARDYNLALVVDNTFTPMVVTPAILGADIVVNSMTKFTNGASDILAGAICGKKDFIESLLDLHTGRVMLLGPTMDPRAAFDLIQRLPHLAIRMREHSRRGMAIAEHLEALGAAVIYPGLPSHPEHELAASMVNQGFGFGGMLALDCKTEEKADDLMSVLQNKEKFGLIAVSLGYFDTLMSCSGSSTSSEISAEDQSEIGISPGLLRIAIGYTGALENRLEQIERAVKEVGVV